MVQLRSRLLHQRAQAVKVDAMSNTITPKEDFLVLEDPPKPAFVPNLGKTGYKADSGKLRYSLIPTAATKALAKILTFGAEKYSKDGWKSVPNAKERYTDALYRHLEAYRSGEKYDEESGESHLAHAITNIAFLIHFEEERDD